MAKLTQYHMTDLTEINDALDAIRSGLPSVTDGREILRLPDVIVLHDVVNAIHLNKPSRRSRRRVAKAIASIYRIVDAGAP